MARLDLDVNRTAESQNIANDLLTPSAGFVVAIALVTFLYLKVAARESWRMSVGLAAGAGLSFYVLFVYLLNVPAPYGPLIRLFIE